VSLRQREKVQKVLRTMTIIGVISDTHSILRPEVEKAFTGCDQILHAGDVGTPTVLDRLKHIAPVTAVRGNMDYGRWSNHLPVTDMVQVEGFFFYVLHDLYRLDLDPVAAGIHVVVHGHTHRPDIQEKGGVTYLNPGSAGHRRSTYPVSVAKVRIEKGSFRSRIVTFDV
jgi:putative phosphoesterase